jgi:hypothetical protein
LSQTLIIAILYTGFSKQHEDFVMKIMRSLLALGLVLSFSPSVHAESVNEAILVSGQYWQRVSVSSAVFQRGPKAQQMLNRDISRCVVELRELERLGEIRDAIPDYIEEDKILSRDEAALANIDVPEREQELFYEHSEYHDFEGCMLAKGWERIKYVPYDVANQAREDYLDAHVMYRDRNEKKEEDSNKDYDHLNE